ncbi:MAG TPA: TIGR03086 family metal-binding protein [Acidimicrobiales bacterium]|nr:TIGR03086 family metal-binding protein [Acidimicrobiales bacterium]
MTEISERYRARADAFERLVAAVRPEQWSHPSPCARWTARDVVDHMVVMHHYMLRVAGRSPGPAPAVADDPLAAFRAARSEVESLLDDAAIAASECDTPTGRMTVEQHVDRVASEDLPLHGWDRARATGQDDPLDPAEGERLWASTSAVPADVMEQYRTPGAFGPGVEVFGPEVVVGADAPLQHRLLGLIGRDPDWRPPA